MKNNDDHEALIMKLYLVVFSGSILYLLMMIFQLLNTNKQQKKDKDLSAAENKE